LFFKVKFISLKSCIISNITSSFPVTPEYKALVASKLLFVSTIVLFCFIICLLCGILIIEVDIMLDVNKQKIMKAVLVFIAYFAYNMVVNCFCEVLGIKDPIMISFIADILFSVVIIFFYRKEIYKSICDFRKDYSFKKRFVIVVLGVLILFVLNILGGIVSEMLFSDLYDVDQNTTMIYELANMSTIYTIFKTLIFASIVENIVFRVSIRELVRNNFAFIIVSSLIYALVNVMYSDFTLLTIVDMVQYFLISFTLSSIYVKYKDSIYPVMMILFCYNMIPLAILLFGIGA